MSAGYRAISWTPHKKVYDLLLGVSVIAYLVIFVVLGLTFRPQATLESQLIRALGTCAFLLLHVILSIGPLARLDSRFLPLLYNRRHLGVTMFLVALGHGLFSIVQFHALGNVNPLVSVLTSNGDYSRFAQFPFQPLGLTALAILFLMAATSHDFWLANLTAPVWKSLHMMVYLAYALIVLHVALGVLQSESNPLLAAFLGVGVLWIAGLHAVAGQRERAGDEASLGEASPGTAAQDGFVTVCGVQEIADNRAKIFTLAGERVAVFRYQGRVSAVSNVCQHQDGPL